MHILVSVCTVFHEKRADLLDNSRWWCFEVRPPPLLWVWWPLELQGWGGSTMRESRRCFADRTLVLQGATVISHGAMKVGCMCYQWWMSLMHAASRGAPIGGKRCYKMLLMHAASRGAPIGGKRCYKEELAGLLAMATGAATSPRWCHHEWIKLLQEASDGAMSDLRWCYRPWSPELRTKFRVAINGGRQWCQRKTSVL
jgi:hypothetical protein